VAQQIVLVVDAFFFLFFGDVPFFPYAASLFDFAF